MLQASSSWVPNPQDKGCGVGHATRDPSSRKKRRQGSPRWRVVHWGLEVSSGPGGRSPAPSPQAARLSPRARPRLPESRAEPVRSVRTGPALSPQGRGRQGAAGAAATRRLRVAARTLRTARSAMFTEVRGSQCKRLGNGAGAGQGRTPGPERAGASRLARGVEAGLGRVGDGDTRPGAASDRATRAREAGICARISARKGLGWGRGLAR